MKDPLADPKACHRDIERFKALGINTIRVYTVDNSADHDECMNALADIGVYVIIDANNPKYSINRENPKKSYNAVYLQSVFATIDAFAKYDNTLAFFSGNEVVNDQNSTLTAQYVKATTRDMRQYIANRKLRKIPVGYSAADLSSSRMQIARYMNCGPDNERSDFFAFNDYSWCNSNFEVSGWNQKVKDFTDYGIPIFLSEYGCTTNGRDFGEIKALMSSQMTSVYSGGLMYEYAVGNNGFGIVELPSGDSTNVIVKDDFGKFAKAMAENPAPSGNGGAKTTSHSVACPTKDVNWLLDTTDLPSLPEPAKEYMLNGPGDAPGLKGVGSQEAGEDGRTPVDPNSGTTTSSTSAPTSTINTSNPPNAGVAEKASFALTGLILVVALLL